jgi:uncharacterized MAPEG superfamily protein
MELIALALAGALVWLCALAQNLTHAVRLGPKFVMSDRSAAPTEDGFAGRAARTLRNHLESSAMFVPVALAVVLLHKTSVLTGYCAIVYIVARGLFTLFYWLGLSMARSTAWTIGMACIAVLFAKSIGVA